jgi:ArsR family transcriptional regulator
MTNVISISKALADKNRLKIIQMLSDESQNVGHVAEQLNVEENLASHHLRVLSGLGFLKSKKKGRQVFYKLNKPKLVAILKDLSKNETFKEIMQEALN